MCPSEASYHHKVLTSDKKHINHCLLFEKQSDESWPRIPTYIIERHTLHMLTLIDINIYYGLVSSKQSNGSWIPPSDWTGPCPVLYQSFDSSDGFVLMEGTQATLDSVPLVSGKVSYISFFRKY